MKLSSIKIWIYISMGVGFIFAAFRFLQYIGVANREVGWAIRDNWWLQLTNPSNNLVLSIVVRLLIIILFATVTVVILKLKPVKASAEGLELYGIVKQIAVFTLIIFILEFLILYLWVFTGHAIPPFTLQ